MNKYINASEAEMIIESEAENLYGEGLDFSAHRVWELQDKIKNMPSADVVEVIRCKDCKHYKSYYDMFKPYYDSPITEDEMHSGQCNYIGKRTGVYMEVNETDFCSKAERKETE